MKDCCGQTGGLCVCESGSPSFVPRLHCRSEKTQAVQTRRVGSWQDCVVSMSRVEKGRRRHFNKGATTPWSWFKSLLLLFSCSLLLFFFYIGELVQRNALYNCSPCLAEPFTEAHLLSLINRIYLHHNCETALMGGGGCRGHIKKRKPKLPLPSGLCSCLTILCQTSSFEFEFRLSCFITGLKDWNKDCPLFSLVHQHPFFLSAVSQVPQTAAAEWSVIIEDDSSWDTVKENFLYSL